MIRLHTHTLDPSDGPETFFHNEYKITPPCHIVKESYGYILGKCAMSGYLGQMRNTIVDKWTKCAIYSWYFGQIWNIVGGL